MTCPICNTAAKQYEMLDWDMIECQHCGRFRITPLAKQELAARAGVLPHFNTLSSTIYHQNQIGIFPDIKADDIIALLNAPVPTVNERADFLLRFVARRSRALGDAVLLNLIDPIIATYSKSNKEVIYLLRYLEQRGWVKNIDNMGGEILPGGFSRLEEMDRVSASSDQGFVAMWFDDQMLEPYHHGLEPGIRHAGYRAHKVDMREHVDKIDDEIIKQIRRSRFIVADFTGHRGGVYFEAGFALGLGLPVFWACRSDDLQHIHFDIRQYNILVWDNPEDLNIRLSRRIEAVIGRGPLNHGAAT